VPERAHARYFGLFWIVLLLAFAQPEGNSNIFLDLFLSFIWAGTIHTDFENGFIKAAVTSYDDYMTSGGLARPRTEGKEYKLQPYDVVEFFIKNART